MESHHWTGSDDTEQFCTEDFDVCPCPSCETWRNNREPSDADREAAGGSAESVGASRGGVGRKAEGGLDGHLRRASVS